MSSKAAAPTVMTVSPSWKITPPGAMVLLLAVATGAVSPITNGNYRNAIDLWVSNNAQARYLQRGRMTARGLRGNPAIGMLALDFHDWT